MTDDEKLLLAYACTQTASVVEALAALTTSPTVQLGRESARRQLHILLRHWCYINGTLTPRDTMSISATTAEVRIFVTRRINRLDELIEQKGINQWRGAHQHSTGPLYE